MALAHCAAISARRGQAGFVALPQRLRASLASLSLLVCVGGMGNVWAQAAPAAPDPVVKTLAEPCAICHGPAGQSQIPGQPSLAGQPRVFIENSLVLIREGMREVPAMQTFVKGLSDAQIEQLARYYAAQPAKLSATGADAAKVARGALLSQQAGCVACHRAGYAGFEQVPRLSGQDESYLLGSMKMFRDAPAPGRDSLMSNSVRGMSDAQLADLAHYLTKHTGAAAKP
jgi:cytochrome c553